MGNRDYLLVFILSLTLLTTLSRCTSALISPADPQPTEQIKAPKHSATKGLPDLITSQPTGSPFNDISDIPAPKPSQTFPAELEPIETPHFKLVSGEVPVDLLDEIIADLVIRTGVAREDIQVVEAEAVVWSDGSLGCPKPGEFYIQILVNGYWVVLQVEGIAHDYRASDGGHFTLCARGGNLPIIPPSSSPSN